MSILPAPAPNGLGTLEVESLTSYARRLAWWEHASVSRLLRRNALEPLRHRRRQRLHQQATQAWSGHKGHCPAAVDKRVGLHQPVARHQGDEQAAVGHLEQGAQCAGEERHDAQLAEGEYAQPVRQRDGRDERGPAHVGGDHDVAALPSPVNPDARVQREQQVRHEPSRRQVAHLDR